MKNLIKKTALLSSLFVLTSLPVFAAETYDVDPVHSSVVYKLHHFGVPNQGIFTDVSGKVVFDEKNPSKTTVDLTIKADSFYTGNGKREEHIKSPDFLNVKQFPEIKFKSKSVKAKGKMDFEVTGDLTLHGVTKEVKGVFTRVGKTKGMKGEMRSGGETTLKLKRSDFGMKELLGPVSDEISLSITVEGILKK
ncbi:MAG: YceI family protein [Candidatus Sericytochromatia bacterium]